MLTATDSTENIRVTPVNTSQSPITVLGFSVISFELTFFIQKVDASSSFATFSVNYSIEHNAHEYNTHVITSTSNEWSKYAVELQEGFSLE